MAKPDTWRSVRASRLSFELKDPPTRAQAVAEICRGLELAGGSTAKAAEMIGVHRRQLTRWMAGVSEIQGFVQKLRIKVGAYHESSEPETDETD